MNTIQVESHAPIRFSRVIARHRGTLLILLALYFTFVGGSYITDLSIGPRIVHHWLLTLLLGGWLLSLLLRRRPWPAAPIDGPVAAFFAVCALSTALAVDPRVSVEELWRLGMHILLLYALVDLMRAVRPRAAFEPLFFASAVVILIGLIEFTSWYTGVPPLPLFLQPWLPIGGLTQPIPPEIYRLSFTLLISTYLSSYMAILIPVGLAWLISTHSPETRRGMALWLAGAVLIETLSFSRGGLLSLAVSLPTFMLLKLASMASLRARLRTAVRDPRFLAAALVLVLFAAGFAFIWTRQADLSGHRTGDRERSALWNAAWEIGLQHPVLGVGPYGYGRALRVVRDPAYTRDHIRPHNIPLQVWAEEGGAGVAALLVMTGATFLAGFRRWRGARGIDRTRVAGALAALAGFSAHNLFDTFTAATPVLLPALVLVAYLVYPLEREPGPAAARLRALAPAAALLAVIAAAAGWAFSDAAQQQFHRAITLADEDDLPGALEAIGRAQALDPAMGMYAAQKAEFAGQLALQDPAALPAALSAYREALSREDSYDLLHTNYALLLSLSGDWLAAREHLQRAAALQPFTPLIWLRLAEVETHLGNGEAATAAYQQSLTYAPHMAASPFWETTDLRRAARDRYLAENGLDVIPLAGLARIPDRCWPAVAALRSGTPSPDSPPITDWCAGEAALRLDEDPAAALRWLDQAISATPADGRFYASRAEARLALADAAGAERDARIALFLGEPRGYYVLGRLAEAAGDLAAAESYYQGYGPLTIQNQAWDVVAYARRGSLKWLPDPRLDAPGPAGYDFAAWLALAQMYSAGGREADALRVYAAIQALDPYLVPPRPNR